MMAVSEVPSGTFTWTSCILSSIAFAALHQAFWAGLVAGIGYAVCIATNTDRWIGVPAAAVGLKSGLVGSLLQLARELGSEIFC